MSTTVDSRVVEMRFENRDFERNANTTMSTLDKLKGKLNFESAAKGLDELDKSAKNLDFSQGVSGLEKMSMKFDALGIIGKRVLENLTDSMMGFVKQVSADLLFNQIDAGFAKYEDKTTSVQTIIAATGKSIEEVNEQLDILQWFTDETSYNFTDMVNNIGKFTSAGVELEDAVQAMQGIATWAARSGANASEASRAMYNLSQSLGAGYVKLIDWKSIENANMATKEFKEQVLEIAKAQKILKEAGKDDDGSILYKWANGASFKTDSGYLNYKNFNDTLQEKWFTKDVLTSVLTVYGGYASAVKSIQEAKGWNTASRTMTEIDRLFRSHTFTGVASDFEKIGEELSITAEEAKAVYEAYNTIGPAAFKAAQEAKTFTEAVSSVKDATSSQFSRLFEYIFGDYQDAKILWTDLAEELWDVFAGPIESLADETYSAMYHRDEYMDFLATLTEAGSISVEQFENTLVEVCKEGNIGLSELGLTFDEVIEKYGSLENPEFLEEDSFRTIEELIAEYGSLERVTELGIISVDEFSEAFGRLGIAMGDAILDDENFLSNLQSITEKGGRAKILEVLYKLWDVIKGISKSIGEAWKQVFGSNEGRLSELIDKFYNFASSLEFTKEMSASLTKTFSQLFNILGSIFSVIRLGIRLGFGLLSSVISPIFSLIKEAIPYVVGFGNSLVENVRSIVNNITDIVSKWWENFKNSEIYKKGSEIVNNIKSFLDEVKNKIKEAFAGFNFGTLSDLLGNIVGGFLMGAESILNSEPVQKAFNAIKQFVSDIVEGFKSVELPTIDEFTSKVAEFFTKFRASIQSVNWEETGSFIAGVASAFKNSFKTTFTKTKNSIFAWLYNLYTKFSPVITKIGEFLLTLIKTIKDVILKTIDIGIDKIERFGTVILKLAKMFATFKLLMSASNLLDSASKYIKSKTEGGTSIFDTIGDFFKSLAIVLAAVAALILVIENIPDEKFSKVMWSTVALIALLVGAIAAIAILMTKMPEVDKAHYGLLVLSVLALASAFAIIANALKNLQDVEINWGALLVVAAAVGVLMLVAKELGSVEKTAGALAIAAFVGALKTLIDTIVYASSIDWEEQVSGIIAIIGIMRLLTKGIKDMGSASGGTWATFGTIIALAIILRAMVNIIEILGTMDPSVVLKGLAVLTYIGGMFTLFSWILSSKGVGKIKLVSVDASFGTILGLSALVMAVALAISVLGNMSWGDLGKGFLFMTFVLGEIVAMLRFLNNVTLNVKTFSIITILIGMVTIIATIGSVIKALSDIPHESLSASSIAIIGALGAMSFLILALTSIVKSKDFAFTNFVQIVLVLGTLLGVLFALIKIFEYINSIKLDPNTQNKITQIGEILLGLIVLTASLALIGAFKGDTVVLAGVKAFAIAIGGVATVLYALGGIGLLLDKIGGERALEKAIHVCEMVGMAIGSIVGGIVGGFVSAASSGLPKVADNLSEFAEKVSPFMDFVSELNGDVASKVSNLGEGISSLLDSFVNFSKNGGKITSDEINEMASHINHLAMALGARNGLFDVLNGVPQDGVDKAEKLSEIIKNISDIATTGGIKSLWEGSTDYDKLEHDLTTYARAVIEFISVMENGFKTGENGNEVKTLSKNALSTLDLVHKITEKLSGTLELIPTESLISKIFGTGTPQWSTLYTGLGEYADALLRFVADLKDFKIDKAHMKSLTDFIKISSELAKVQNEIGSGIGVMKSLFTDAGDWSSLGGFKGIRLFNKETGESKMSYDDPKDSSLVRFGNTLVAFLEIFKGKEDILKNSSQVVTIVKDISDVLNKIDLGTEDTGFMGFIKKTDLQILGEELEKFGTGLAGFTTKGESISEKGLEKIEKVMGTLQLLGDINTESKSFSDVASNLSYIAGDLWEYSLAVKGTLLQFNENYVQTGIEIIKTILSGMQQYLISDEAKTMFAEIAKKISDSLNMTGDDSSFVITPVVDMTSIDEAYGKIQSITGAIPVGGMTFKATSAMAGSVSNSINYKEDLVSVNMKLENIHNDLSNVNNGLTNINSNVNSSMSTINGNIMSLKSIYSSIKVVLDSNTLVGKLVPKIDKALGRITGRIERTV